MTEWRKLTKFDTKMPVWINMDLVCRVSMMIPPYIGSHIDFVDNELYQEVTETPEEIFYSIDYD